MRREAEALAKELGFPASRVAQVGLVALEVATNLQRHAVEGRAAVQANEGAVEIVSIDQGPGFDLELLADGRSTKGTMGAGFGTMQRFSQHFDVNSSPRGTVVVCRLYGDRAARPVPRLGGVVSGLEIQSGDKWAWRNVGGVTQVIAVDGAGHGPQAAEAAEEVVRAFHDADETAPDQLLTFIHRRVGATRGAAATVANINGSLQYAGIGNVDGRWYADRRRGVAATPGTLGNNLAPVKPVAQSLDGPGTLVLCSDGLLSSWSDDVTAQTVQRDPTMLAGCILRDHGRGTDDAMVVVCRGGE